MQKKVNIKVQCLATIFIPSGIYAFKRINKLRQGTVLYVITFVIGLVQSATMFPSDPVMFTVIALVILAMGFIIPIVFIKKWSSDWNKRLET